MSNSLTLLSELFDFFFHYDLKIWKCIFLETDENSTVCVAFRFFSTSVDSYAAPAAVIVKRVFMLHFIEMGRQYIRICLRRQWWLYGRNLL